MDFLFNDMSLAGQFPNVDAFRESVGRLMEIRQEIHRMGSSLYCHRKVVHARVTANVLMQQAVQALPISERRAWMQWLMTHGPYWEDARLHSEAAGLKCSTGYCGRIVRLHLGKVSERWM